jgi:N-acetylglutamate synthase-like GNAT family acetyltransferase
MAGAPGPDEFQYTLRPAARPDAAGIRALVYAVHINPTGLDWRRFVVAVSPAGRLIGCGQVKPHGKPPDTIYELASIAVAPAWRGRGVARSIVTRLLAESPASLYLTCRAELEPFYRKFGFRALGPDEMPAYFQRLSRLFRLFSRSGIVSGNLLVMKRLDSHVSV